MLAALFYYINDKKENQYSSKFFFYLYLFDLSNLVYDSTWSTCTYVTNLPKPLFFLVEIERAGELTVLKEDNIVYREQTW